MARRYTRRYRRRRKYYRRRIPRKRFLRGVDRNNFCIVQGGNITYTFDKNSMIGFPNKYINFAVKICNINSHDTEVAISALASNKFMTLSKLYDQVRLKGMSVKISYVADTGTSAQTLNLVTIIDRCAPRMEIATNYTAMATNASTKLVYLNKIDNAASRRKVSLTGGKTVYLYYRASGIEESMFQNIDEDKQTDTESDITYLVPTMERVFNGFNPCIYSYMEKSAAAEQTQTSVVVNVEVKYYIEFKNSC